MRVLCLHTLMGVMGACEHSQYKHGAEGAGAEDGPTEEDTVVRPCTPRHGSMGRGTLAGG